MRSFFFSACLATTICTAMAIAQSPVAYVYVAEDTSDTTTTSPIAAYAASSDGSLTQIKGSPFTQVSGIMGGTNGTHFITVDMNGTTTHQYLHVYDVASDGVIGEEVSKQDLHEWCGSDGPAEFDHTGQYVYVLESQPCGGGYLSFALSKSGELTFKGSFVEGSSPFYSLPVFSGNDNFAYNFTPSADSQEPCPTNSFIGLGREGSGALENIGFSETDPTPPAGYQVFQQGLVTDDPTNHLASVIYSQDGLCGQNGFTPNALASYTVESNGDLVSTNTWENVAQLDGYLGSGAGIKLNAAGNILAVTVGAGIQFFHFNGAAPITPFTGTGIVGTSGDIDTMTWDNDNHLYALDGKSGKLYVYTATTTTAVEAPGSPYLPPNNCTSGGCWPQNLIVRRIP